jgi:hypothetical protein
LDVLLLCAAPLDVRPALNLAVEVANLEAEVRRSTVPIRLRRVFPPTFDQLRRELAPTSLRGREPRVFHFLGHGEEDYLWFEDEEGGGEKVTVARLRKVFEGTPIRLALLNACWSATHRVKNLCTHLVEGAGLAATIGHGKEVADASAIASPGASAPRSPGASQSAMRSSPPAMSWPRRACPAPPRST